MQTCVLGIACSACAQTIRLAIVKLQTLWCWHQRLQNLTGVLVGCAVGRAHSDTCIVSRIQKLASLRCALLLVYCLRRMSEVDLAAGTLLFFCLFQSQTV